MPSSPQAILRVLPADITLRADIGEKLLDVCDAHPNPPIPFSCRSATCGTCRVRVIDGTEVLNEVGDDELALLEMLGAAEDERLACQIVAIEAGPVTLEAEYG